MHAQFEAIHPFVDGNGRVGRLLFPLMFLGDGDLPIHLATFFKRRQAGVLRTLCWKFQTKLRWSPWIELFLECSVASCRHTVHLLSELRSIADRCTRVSRRGELASMRPVWRVADLLLGQPVVTVTALVERLQVTFQSANAAVAVLVDMDILRPQGAQAPQPRLPCSRGYEYSAHWD